MFTLQYLLWHGVKPIVQKGVHKFCISTGIIEEIKQPENYGLKEVGSENTHTKNFHEKWLSNRNSRNKQNAHSSSQGSWIKELFAQVIRFFTFLNFKVMVEIYT